MFVGVCNFRSPDHSRPTRLRVKSQVLLRINMREFQHGRFEVGDVTCTDSAPRQVEHFQFAAVV